MNGDGAQQTGGQPPVAVLFMGVAMPLFLGMMDQTIVSTALFDISESFGSFDQVSWVVVAYLAANAISAPLYGRLGDAIGRRRMMVVSLAVSMLGSAGCMLAPSFLWLVIARAVQGLGGGGLIALAQALVGQSFEPRKRARYQGYLATVAMTASTMGPVLGGFLTEAFGWRAIFALNLPLGCVGLFLIMRLPPRRRPIDDVQINSFSVALLASTLLLLIGLTVPGLGTLQCPILAAALLTSAAVLAFLFFRHESRTHCPLFPAIFLRDASIRMACALALFHGALYVSLFTFVPVYFSAMRGFSSGQAGLLLLPVTIGVGIGSLLTGSLVSRTGYLTVFPAVGLAVAAVLLVGIGLYTPHLPMVALACLFSVVALMLGTVMGVVQLVVQIGAGDRMLGIASASVLLTRSLGASLGAALSGLVVMSGATREIGFSSMFLLAAGFAFCAALLAWLTPHGRIASERAERL
ncbi:MFS transporter [Corticibacterium sp. UT-5YL-CI-8]|nr:MFS transporter [Tianweitania sp. UT-5YL-CI-8]